MDNSSNSNRKKGDFLNIADKISCITHIMQGYLFKQRQWLF
jgi:hypothetical protein